LPGSVRGQPGECLAATGALPHPPSCWSAATHQVWKLVPGVLQEMVREV
jgi:hypothetical protein